MVEIKIKEATLPSRCEVCHQTDCYDPLNNYCSRCVAIIPIETKLPQTNQRRPISIKHFSQELWQTSFRFKLALIIPLLWIVTVFAGMLFENSYISQYHFYNISCGWAVFILITSLIPAFIQTYNRAINGVKIFKIMTGAQVIMQIFFKLHMYYFYFLNSSNPIIKQLMISLYTTQVWIADIIIPLLYIIFILFIPDRTFPTLNSNPKKEKAFFTAS